MKLDSADFFVLLEKADRDIVFEGVVDVEPIRGIFDADFGLLNHGVGLDIVGGKHHGPLGKVNSEFSISQLIVSVVFVLGHTG